MTLRLFPLAMLLMLLVLAGCSSTPESRPEALATLTRLWNADAPARAYDEYLSVEETFTHAEALQKKNDERASEDYYRLALVKGKMLEEEMSRVPSKQFTSCPDGNMPGNPSSVAGVAPEQLIANQPPPVRERGGGYDYGMSEGASSVTGAGDDGNELPRPHVRPSVVKSGRLIGGEEHYVVKKGDTLQLAGARLGVSWRYLAKINKLDPKKYLYEGQELRVVNRKIVPKRVRNGLVINIPDRMMYYFKQGHLVKSIPVALGRPNPRDMQKDNVVWHTPTGVFRILAKEKDPVWRVPPSIQKEMEEQGQEVISRVPPGEKNPLGRYALRTSIPGILIHSTIRPASIYGFSSHGCIRVSPAMMEDLFREIEVNTRGEIIYDPIMVAVTQNGRVFLEVNRDVYDKKIDFEKEVKEALCKNRATGKVDWRKVDLVLKSKLGIAEDVTM